MEREAVQEKGSKWGKNVAVKDFVAMASCCCCCFYDQYFFGGVACPPTTSTPLSTFPPTPTSTFCCSPDCARQCAAALFKDEAQQQQQQRQPRSQWQRKMQLKHRCNDGTFQKSTRKICACIGRATTTTTTPTIETGSKLERRVQKFQTTSKNTKNT